MKNRWSSLGAVQVNREKGEQREEYFMPTKHIRQIKYSLSLPCFVTVHLFFLCDVTAQCLHPVTAAKLQI